MEGGSRGHPEGCEGDRGISLLNSFWRIRSRTSRDRLFQSGEGKTSGRSREGENGGKGGSSRSEGVYLKGWSTSQGRGLWKSREKKKSRGMRRESNFFNTMRRGDNRYRPSTAGGSGENREGTGFWACSVWIIDTGRGAGSQGEGTTRRKQKVVKTPRQGKGRQGTWDKRTLGGRCLLDLTV